MRIQMMQVALGAALFMAACGGEIGQTEDQQGTTSVVSSQNSYCYDISSGSASTGRKCFTTKTAFCQSLCTEKISGAASQCKLQCPGWTPAPTDGGVGDGGSSGGGTDGGTSGGSYCYNLQCTGRPGTGQRCFATKTAFCDALKKETCSSAAFYASLLCK